MLRTSIRILLVAALPIGLAACSDAEPGADDEAAGADTGLPDTLTTREQSQFAVDPLRYNEMHDGRLDTVDMVGRSEDGNAAWHVQAMNYADQYIAMTYAAWHTGPDSVARFAADAQPRLVDDLGNVYHGSAVPGNPRIGVENGSTAIGVYVFGTPVAPRADSLTLYVNDSTPPVIRVGPFGVEHDAGTGSLRMGASPSGDGLTTEEAP